MKKIVICTEDLYKSTYNSNAFNKGKQYSIIEETDKFYYILDEKNHPFNLAKHDHGVFYFFDKYFKFFVIGDDVEP